VSNVARLRRGLLAAAVAGLAAVAVAASGLPASAAPVTRTGEWWLNALRGPASNTGHGVTVAVLSTGVDGSHPDLSGRVATGPDFAPGGRRRGGAYWGAEGTAVASLIAGHGHGAGHAAGVTGVAPGARILSVPVTLEYDDPLNADTAVTRRLPGAIAAGIRYAVGHGAEVIALPLDPGTLSPSPQGDPAAGGSAAERAAVAYAEARNVVLVAPAGDNGAGTDADNYPAAYRGVTAVGATGPGGRLASFTSRHSYVGLTAPGTGLTVAGPDGGYQSLASTDMAAALTAGVAALIRSRYPRLTAAEVSQALERGVTRPAEPAGGGGGHGELSASGALAAAATIAAAHPAPSSPAPSPDASPSASAGPAPSSAPATAPAAPPVTRGQPSPGRLLRLLVIDLVVAAGVLIVVLACVITLTRRRRRRRRAQAADAARMESATGPERARARHARGQPATAGPASPPRAAAPFAPASIPLAPLPPAVPAPAPPDEDEPYEWPPPGEHPPWPTAREPGSRVSPESFLPAPSGNDPARENDSSRPGPNTGPIYVWDPAATTAALDTSEEAGD
jgi:Subtilase family